MRTQIGKNVLLIIISLGLILQIGTSEVFGWEVDDYTYDVSKGNIVIEKGTEGDTLKVMQNEKIVLDNIPGDTMLTLTGTSTEEDNHKVEINGVKVNITFDQLKIKEKKTVQIIEDSTVNLTLVGENVVTNTFDSFTDKFGAGLGVSDGSTLNITTESTGQLTVTAGNYGAGIGGGREVNCGEINIFGGIIIATGGNFSAGIGGGWNSTGGIVNISGGTITANGGQGRGAGIGGGGVSSGKKIASGEVNISGGIVTATGGTYGAGIGGGGGVNTGEITAAGNVNISGGTVIATGGSEGGSGIGGGKNSVDEGTFVANGHAFIIASSIGANDYIESKDTQAIIFDGENGVIYGNPTINYNAAIPDDKTLIIENGKSITINEGIILTNNGTIVNNGIIFINGGSLEGNELSGDGKVVFLHTVDFSVVAGNGSVNSNPIISNGDSIIEQNLAFKALPDENYRVKEWKVNGEVLENNTETSIELTIDKKTSVTVEFELIVPDLKIFTVIFLNYDGREISKIEVEEGKPAIAPANPDRGGHIFTGWDKEFNDIKSNTIVRANYRQISSGVGGSPSTNFSELVDNRSKETTIKLIDDTINVNVSQYEVSNAIKKAQADAKKNASEQRGISIEIIVDTKNINPSNLSANIPKDAIGDLIKAKVKGISIKSNIGTIKLDLETLKTIEKNIHGDVNLSMKKVENIILSEEIKAIVGDGLVFDLSIIGKDGKKVSEFGKGKISISLPYTLKENEEFKTVVIYYIDSNGNIKEMPNSIYDRDTEIISFDTNHFSKFAIGYKQNIAEIFTDIEGHWAKNDIEFVVAKGLFNGTGNKKFSPHMPMTRGMFVTVLGRLANVDVKRYKHSSFTDIKPGSYYMDYIEWASENRIIEGISQGKFAPDLYINREEMAVVLYRYSQFQGYDTTQGGMAIREFRDYEEISEYALQAMGWTVNTGLLQGSNINLMPKESTTRGEISAILNRFYKIIIK